MSERTFDASTASQAKTAIVITAGVRCIAFVNSADFEAFTFETALTIITLSIIIHHAVAIIVDAVTDFFGVESAESTKTAQVLIYRAVAVIVVAITGLNFLDEARNTGFYAHLTDAITDGANTLLTGWARNPVRRCRACVLIHDAVAVIVYVVTNVDWAVDDTDEVIAGITNFIAV